MTGSEIKRQAEEAMSGKDVRVDVSGFDLYDANGDPLDWIMVPVSRIPGIVLTPEEAGPIRAYFTDWLTRGENYRRGAPAGLEKFIALLTPASSGTDELPMQTGAPSPKTLSSDEQRELLHFVTVYGNKEIRGYVIALLSPDEAALDVGPPAPGEGDALRNPEVGMKC